MHYFLSRVTISATIVITERAFLVSQIRELLDYIEEHWKIMSSDPQNEILRSYAEQSKVLLIRYAGELYYYFITIKYFHRVF